MTKAVLISTITSYFSRRQARQVSKFDLSNKVLRQDILAQVIPLVYITNATYSFKMYTVYMGGSPGDVSEEPVT